VRSRSAEILRKTAQTIYIINLPSAVTLGGVYDGAELHPLGSRHAAAAE